MSNNKYNTNLGVSLSYSNRKLTEFPKELYKYKTNLISLDISGNPLLDLDIAIDELREFKSLKRLKINIETGEEAKKLIQALPFLQVLNDIKIQQEEETINENKTNIKEQNILKEDSKIKEKEIENDFEKILEKIKEYDNITKEKFDIIINDYNKLISKNNIRNILEICSFFNKILINLIKDAQEKENIKISSLKPLLEAQSQNEFIRMNYESKINIKNNNNIINDTTSFLSIDSPNEKIKQIKTETTSISFVNSNKNLTNTNKINNKKMVRNYSTYNKNKNEIRKEYSKNIKKNLSLSKNKKIDKETKSEIESNKSNNTLTIKNIENCFSEKKSNKEFIQQSRNPNIKNIKKIDTNQKPKKKFKFTHKSHNKKILNKTSLLYNQENTDGNSNINTNVTNVNTDTLTQTMNIENNNNNNTAFKKNIKNTPKYMNKSISTISDNNIISPNINYLSKYDMLKNCAENSTINSFLTQIESKNFVISNIFDNLKEVINIDINSIRVLNIKNFLEIISQVYKQRNMRLEKKRQGMSNMKGTLEIDLLSYLKARYGLKKLIVEWILIIFSSIKAYSKINGEVCLFGLILRNELDEGSIDILQKIKETMNNLLNYVYKYNTTLIEKIKNNKEFMKENEWTGICEILYSNDINLRENFIKKIKEFINKMVKSEKILEKIGKKILFCDFLNLLIMFNLRQRKRYLNNLVKFFQKYDKEKYGIINYDEFKSMIKDFGIFDKNKINDITNYLIEKIDKETTGLITFNEIVECFDNYYLDNVNNKNEDKVKLLDKISNLIY